MLFKCDRVYSGHARAGMVLSARVLAAAVKSRRRCCAIGGFGPALVYPEEALEDALKNAGVRAFDGRYKLLIRFIYMEILILCKHLLRIG